MSNNNDYPRLCGGTFLTLILQARPQRTGSRQRCEGLSDGLSDADVLKGLIRVIDSSYQDIKPASMKSLVNGYKSCNRSTGESFPFDDEIKIDSFDDTVKNQYKLVENKMDKFVAKFINLGDGGGKYKLLVSALIDLIQNDKTIDPNAEFYIRAGSTVKKKDFCNLQFVELSGFLLGVWHYIVTNIKNNQVGKTTYDILCPPGEKRTKRKYQGTLGTGINLSLRVIVPPKNDSGGCVADKNTEDKEQSEVFLFRRYLTSAIDYYSKVKMLYYSEDSYDFEEIVEPLDVTQNFVAYSRFQNKVERIKLTPEKIKEISPHLLIRGGGGSGKSWLIKHLFFQYAKEFDTSLIVPYLISLENYKQCVTVESLIYESVRLFKLSQDIIRKNIENEKVVLLLDGYDEIAIDSKQSFDEELSVFIQKYPGIRIIMTSRPIELLGIDSSFKYLHILPLTEEQQSSILSKLFRNKKMDPWVANLILRYRYKDDLLKTPLFLSYWYNEWKKREKYLINYLQFLRPKSEQFGQVDREICSKIYSCSIYHAKNIYAIYEALATKSYKRQSVRNLGYTNISAKQMFSVIIKFVAIAYKDHVMAFDNCSVDKYLNNALEDESQELRAIPREYYIQDLTDNLSILSYTDGMYYYTSPKIIRFCVARFLQLLNDDDFIRWFKDLNLYQVDDSEINDLFEILYELDPNKIEKNIFCHFIKNRMIPDGLLDGTNSKGYWLLMIRKYNYFRFSISR